ncbi:hypothetical protein UP15_01565 [Bacillus pumilus]|nr:hypothetical protein UP15_01565 [Bacillus pumilus]
MYKNLETEVVFILKDVLGFTSQSFSFKYIFIIRIFFFQSVHLQIDFQRAEYLNVENDSWENKDD